MVLKYIKFGVLTVLAFAAHVSQVDAKNTIDGDITPEAGQDAAAVDGDKVVEYDADGNPLPEK